MNITTETSKEYFKILFEYLGFKTPWKVHTEYSMLNSGITVALVREIDYIKDLKDVKDLADAWRAELQQSEVIKDLTSDLTSQVNKLVTENETLKQQVEDLKKYKFHYDLELNLKRGFDHE